VVDLNKVRHRPHPVAGGPRGRRRPVGPAAWSLHRRVGGRGRHIAADPHPQHYLVGKMSNLSADALIAAEAGLVKRWRGKSSCGGAKALREMFRLIALARARAKPRPCGGRGCGRTPEASATQMRTRGEAKTVGFPFDTWPPLRLTRRDRRRGEDRERSRVDPMGALLNPKSDLLPRARS